VRDYASYPKDQLRTAFVRIRKKLGGQHLQAALDALEEDDFGTAARIALVYYDKAYAHYADRMPPGRVTEVVAESPDPHAIARQLLHLCD
jgi:tRNA 2-selenouridine synthase